MKTTPAAYNILVESLLAEIRAKIREREGKYARYMLADLDDQLHDCEPHERLALCYTWKLRLQQWKRNTN